MTNTNQERVVCQVCGGKGGFRKSRESYLESDWMDCPYCEGYGFVHNVFSEEESNSFLTYSKYRNLIMTNLEELGEILDIHTKSIGKDLFISIDPKDRGTWVGLVRSMLKFSFYSNTIDIQPKQCFAYTPQNRHKNYWELHITMHSFKDVEGLVDLIKIYNAKG